MRPTPYKPSCLRYRNSAQKSSEIFGGALIHARGPEMANLQGPASKRGIEARGDYASESYVTMTIPIGGM
jgi:hypothetical protein